MRSIKFSTRSISHNLNGFWQKPAHVAISLCEHRLKEPNAK